MLAQLLKIITPDALASAIRTNPVVIQSALQKFDTYIALGQALSNNQQLTISNNLNKLEAFFKDDTGKKAISNLGSEFCNFIEVEKEQAAKATKAPLIEATNAMALRAQIEKEVRAEMELKQKK